MTTITPSEHDGGYSLSHEAKSTAGKLNQAIRTIRAFKKRIKACETHKKAGLKQEPGDKTESTLDDKIDELEIAIRVAETDRAKCEARLNKLREGGVSLLLSLLLLLLLQVEVDAYLDNALQQAIDSDAAKEAGGEGPADWGSSGAPSKVGSEGLTNP